MASEQNSRHPTTSEYESKSFRKWLPGTPAIPKTLQKHFHQFRNFVPKTSESITGRIPRGHRHTHWLAMRYPTSWGRNITCVDASGLVLGTIGIQEPKSGYHYGDCALIETTLMTNPVEPWKMGLLTPHTFFTPCALLQKSFQNTYFRFLQIDSRESAKRWCANRLPTKLTQEKATKKRETPSVNSPAL